MSTAYPADSIRVICDQIYLYISHHRYIYNQLRKKGLLEDIQQPFHAQVESAAHSFLFLNKAKVDAISWKEIHELLDSTRIGLCEAIGFRFFFIDYDIVMLKAKLFAYKLKEGLPITFTDGNREAYFESHHFCSLKRYPGARKETKFEKQSTHKKLREMGKEIISKASCESPV